MSYGIFVWEIAGSGVPIHAWIADYDVDAFDGRGHTALTKDPAKALRFPTAKAAWDAWSQQSTVHPWRLTDGQPNRPLTSYTVEIAPLNDRS